MLSDVWLSCVSGVISNCAVLMCSGALGNHVGACLLYWLVSKWSVFACEKMSVRDCSGRCVLSCVWLGTVAEVVDVLCGQQQHFIHLMSCPHGEQSFVIL